jgi:indolepyruvate ferredoxin oxidoreductase beta subunit
MSYEDAIRVADLKIRRDRFERVRRESGVANGQLLEINEFLHPRAAEIADILPAWLGRWLLETRWAQRLVDRFTHHGRIVRTTSLRGFLQLYSLAGLRRWRRSSFRFQKESRAIREWLERIPALAKEDYALALEVAECPGLIKGYGDTHALGTRNFEAVLGALPGLKGKSGAAIAFKKLREAALADDSGKQLSDALREVNA